MASPRPCRVCSCWFSPSGKVGNRQHVCGKPECQKEWHRQACARWRKHYPDEARARKVVHQVTRKAPAEQPVLDPLVAINWKGVRMAVGLKSMIVMREITKVLQRALRETSSAQTVSNHRNTIKVQPRGRRETSSGKPFSNQIIGTKVQPSSPRDEMASGAALP